MMEGAAIRHNVMDEDALERAIQEQTPDNEAGRITLAAGTCFSKVTMLHMEFKGIMRIQNLFDFKSLTRLYLNNNQIERIEGLETLLHVTWLNLCGNRIEKIQGLDSMTKLEVLNLSYNRISVIENMDKLQKLSLIFISYNQIPHLDNVLYLRQFKDLRSLNLAGNPLSQEEEYRIFIAAFLPNLTLLDYRLVCGKTKKEAFMLHQSAIEKLTKEELDAELVHEAEAMVEAQHQLEMDAFVEFLDGPQLFESMFKEDLGAKILQQLRGLDYLFHQFEKDFMDMCTQLLKLGLIEHQRRQDEISAFQSVRANLFQGHQQEVQQVMMDFEHKQHERIEEMKTIFDKDELNGKIDYCRKEINQLHHKLMALDMLRDNQLEDLIRRLNFNINELVNNFSETATGIFTSIRDLEDKYYKSVQEIAVAALVQDASDDDESTLYKDFKWQFPDKQTLMDALVGAHDNHMMKINDRETEMMTRLSAWKVVLIKGYQDKELEWNRMTIRNHLRYRESFLKQLENFY